MGRVRIVVMSVAAASMLLISPMAGAAGNATEEAIADDLFAAINTARTGAGKPALARVEFIDKQAYKHSKYMARKKRLSHNGFKKRRVRAIRRNDPGIGAACENVAYARGFAADQVDNVFFDGWMASSGHRRCMLDVDSAKNEGGVAVRKRGGRYYGTFIAVFDQSP